MAVGKSSGRECTWQQRGPVCAFAGLTREREARKVSGSTYYSSAPAPSPGQGQAEEGASRVLQHWPLKLAWVKQSHTFRDTGGLQPCSVVGMLRGLFSLPKPLPVNTIQVTEYLWSYAEWDRGALTVKKPSTGRDITWAKFPLLLQV